MDQVTVKINGIEVKVPANSTILEAAHTAGVRIPTLCYLRQINAIAAPLNARYKLAIGGMVFLPSVLLMALLFLFVPKTAMPIDKGL